MFFCVILLQVFDKICGVTTIPHKPLTHVSLPHLCLCRWNDSKWRLFFYCPYCNSSFILSCDMLWSIRLLSVCVLISVPSVNRMFFLDFILNLFMRLVFLVKTDLVLIFWLIDSKKKKKTFKDGKYWYFWFKILILHPKEMHPHLKICSGDHFWCVQCQSFPLHPKCGSSRLLLRTAALVLVGHIVKP